MKKLLLSAVVLSTCSLWSQLHVSPSTTSDTYIYANDVVVYVEDYVDLERNSTGAYEASVYLRGFSQLMQGDGGVNSGDGQLSIWQRGWADNFGYHYWGSPVGNNTPIGVSNTGNINFGITAFYDPNWDSTIERVTEAKRAHNISGNDGYRDSLRIARKWINILGAAGNYASWIQVGANNNIHPGVGFSMKGTEGTDFDNRQLYDFRGRPNNGTITLSWPNDAGAWMLVGNPYPSHLDLTDFFNQNQSIHATAYFYEKSPDSNTHILNEIESGYVTWIPGGEPNTVNPLYIGGTGNTSQGIYAKAVYKKYDLQGNPIGDGGYEAINYGDDKHRFATIGQGFVVKRKAFNNSSLQFNNSMRRYIPHLSGEYHNTFKSAPVEDGNGYDVNSDFSTDAGSIPTEPINNFSLLRFYVDVNDTYVRDIPLILNNTTTTGDDRGWDARHPGLVGSGDAFWIVDGETARYVIQSRPYHIDDFIPLGIKSGTQPVTYKVKLAEKVNFNGRVYLLDKYTGIYQRIYSINPEDANVNHATILTNEAVDYKDRYYIVYKLGPDAGVVKSVTNISFFQNNRSKQLEVYNKDREVVSNLSVYDMSGKLVIDQSNLGDDDIFSFGTSHLSDGIYLVILTTEDNRLIDYKISIQNKN